MICALVVLVLIAAAGVAAYSGHGVADSRDTRFSLLLRQLPAAGVRALPSAGVRPPLHVRRRRHRVR